jgi:NAD(P)-dependent dehydrogenase (short-subunit alcohol dehydrogenase family)
MSILESLRPKPGLRVLVTAGASGIGATIAQAYREAGAQVHICDIDKTAIDQFTANNPGITASMADASIPAEIDLVFDNVRTNLGGLDILVNNAGIAGPTGPIESFECSEWERTMAVNLNSQFYFSRRAIPMLKQSTNNPCLIAMSSTAGRLGYPFRTPYASTKWAIVGLMKSLASELGPHGIRANAILPGAVEGERMNSVIKARAVAQGKSFDAMHDEYLQKISLRRMVSAEDVAAMALFLGSPAARNITGQAISVDGNMEYL